MEDYVFMDSRLAFDARRFFLSYAAFTFNSATGYHYADVAKFFLLKAITIFTHQNHGNTKAQSCK